MPTPIESNQFTLYAGRQSARGVDLASPLLQLRQVSGALSIAKDLGSEQYGDGQRFSGGAMDYTNTISGGGTPTLQASPLAAGAMLAWTLGAWATIPGGYRFTPGDSAPYIKYWASVGETAAVAKREEYRDSRNTGLTLTSSTGSKVLHATPTVVSLDPGVTYATEPTPTVTSGDGEPWLHTNLVGALEVDGVAIANISQVELAITDGSAPWYGESVYAGEVVPGRGTIGATATVLLTDQSKRYAYNRIVYGIQGDVPAGTRPIQDVFKGSLRWTWARNVGEANEESLEIVIPNFRFSTETAIEPAVEGGGVELALAGEARNPANGDPILTATLMTPAVVTF